MCDIFDYWSAFLDACKGIGTILAVLIAWKALRSWQQQKKHDLARRALISAMKYCNSINDARVPRCMFLPEKHVWESEWNQISHKSRGSFQYFAVGKALKLSKDLEAEFLLLCEEVGTILGSKYTEPMLALVNSHYEIDKALLYQNLLDRNDPDWREELSKQRKEINRILIDDSHGDQPDEFSATSHGEVETLKKLLRKFLKL